MTQTWQRLSTGASDGLPVRIRGDLGAIIQRPHDAPLERENPDLLASPNTDNGTIPNLTFSFATARNRLLTGGWAREVTVREVPVAIVLAGVNMGLKPWVSASCTGTRRLSGSTCSPAAAAVTAVDEQGRTFSDDVGKGDLWNFLSVIPHSSQRLDEGCEFLLAFDNGNFSENQTFLITDLFKHTPRDVLAKNFGVPDAAFANLPINVEQERYIFTGKVPGPMASDTVQSGAGLVPQSFSHHMAAQDSIQAPGVAPAGGHRPRDGRRHRGAGPAQASGWHRTR